MHFDTRQHGTDGRRAQVGERGHRRADQDDLVPEAPRGDAVLEDVGDGHVREALVAAVRDQGGRRFVDRYLEGPDPEGFEPLLLEARRHLRRRAEGFGHRRAEDGERKSLVVRALELGQQGHAPQHAVGIAQRIDVAGAGGILEDHRQVAGIALPLVELGVAPGKAALAQHRLGQRVDPDRAIVAVEVIAEDDRPVLQARREACVEIEARPQAGVRRLELRCIFQRALRETIEHVDAGARIALRPDDVERQELHAMALEQLVEQLGHDVAAPGPAADLAQALLVDVEDDDAVVTRARHRHREARVVQDVVQLGDEADALEAQRVAHEEQHDRKAEDDPYDVLFQAGPFRPSGRIPS